MANHVAELEHRCSVCNEDVSDAVLMGCRAASRVLLPCGHAQCGGCVLEGMARMHPLVPTCRTCGDEFSNAGLSRSRLPRAVPELRVVGTQKTTRRVAASESGGN